MSPLRALALMVGPDKVPLHFVEDDQETSLYIGEPRPYGSRAGVSVRSAADDRKDHAGFSSAFTLPDRARRIRVGDLVIAWWGPDPRKDGAP